MERRRLHRCLQRAIGEERDDRIGLLDPHPGNTFSLDELEMEAHGGGRLGGGAGEFRVALACVDIAQREERAGMMDREMDAIAGRDIPDVQVAAPLALPVDTGEHFAVRRNAERADEGRDGPGDLIAEAHRAVAHRAAWSLGRRDEVVEIHVANSIGAASVDVKCGLTPVLQSSELA